MERLRGLQCCSNSGLDPPPTHCTGHQRPPEPGSTLNNGLKCANHSAQPRASCLSDLPIWFILGIKAAVLNPGRVHDMA